jgi:hypothetical protein
MRKTNRSTLLFATVFAAVIASAVALASAAGRDRADAEALQAFGVVQKVLQHPRCQNCHIPGDAPLQFDQGLTHAQNIKRGKNGLGAAGAACSTCHSTENPPASYGAHTPPGAPNWALPPPEHKMVFIGKSAGELCRGLTNKAENGGRDLAGLRHHLDDKLVLWGWDPGVGRAPVDVPREEFIAAFEKWAKAGGPCPAS